VIVKLMLEEASAKVRSGSPIDQDEDLSLPVWAAQIPLRMRALAPVSDDSSGAGEEGPAVPAYAAAYTRPGWAGGST
jgi:uncharacterized protein